MNGHMAAVGPCWSCGRTFMFDPERVPSIVADGSRQPLCRDCVQRANELRERQGLARIVPLPGAYVDD